MKNFLLSLTLFVLVTSILAFITLGCSRGPGVQASPPADADTGFHPPPPFTPTVVPVVATALPTAAPTPTATSIATVAIAQAQPTVAAADAVTIAYRDDGGFFPKRIDIEPGTTVIFRNDSTEPIWPASNIHPNHEVFPEFDANRTFGPARPTHSPLTNAAFGDSTTTTIRKKADSLSSSAVGAGLRRNRWS